MNQAHQKQAKSIFRTLKYLDNNIDKILQIAIQMAQQLQQKESEQENQDKVDQNEEEEDAEDQDEQEENQEQQQDKIEEKREVEQEEEGEDQVEQEEGVEESEKDPYYNQNNEEDDYFEDEQETQKSGENKDITHTLDLNINFILKDLILKGVINNKIEKIFICYKQLAYMRAIQILISVKCKQCKYDTELTLCNFMTDTNENILVNNLVCVSCNRISQIYSTREIIYDTKNALVFRIGSFTWQLNEIRNVSYILTCKECDNQKRS
ncbi:hypothetical protein IMG5_045470 [Ichthyophthirius multifiliis]|uniref:Uncharacterized protein n=1 Tax=Ichthyophthirius multifiliis TaxID=5932 RepID=G0QM66_ICHMU|nr:hypothetical protein IMG5_045470 [Ichthyophthirius multifiliis]EGR33689.1 hypothetical protein IMG5_045470 [Ichthyophthirius multifiliis]|eukprot:XP_004037675.1 hypothetical protein IMG5_045470 [Ichthyophthirius multifiliis]